MDTQGTGIEALRMLVPSGWQSSGGVLWRLNNPGMPAVISLTVYNPTGEEALEILPSLGFTWTNNPMVTMMFPVGSLYFGNEVRPPMDALQALRQIIVPRARGNTQGLQIVREERLPDLAQQAKSQNPLPQETPTVADGGRVRISYQRGPHSVEEEIYTVVEVVRLAQPTMFGMQELIFWWANYTFSCRALTGRLDDLSDLFRVMISSVRLNPVWFSRYNQVSQYLIQNQIQQIQSVGQLSRIIHQTSNQISDDMLASFYRRQEAMDRLSSSVSQAIRGVDEYHNPFEERGVELPGGYNYAWANNLGEYIVSDDPNFNPNIGSNLHWELMQRK
jgi:hypothetical protein